MANKLFNELNLNNSTSRNGFDLSHNVKFTAKAGELLPIMHKTVMYGDKFRINLNSFTRTAPVQTAAFTQIREYFDFFFVPYRILWKNAPNVLVSNQRNPSIAKSLSSSVVVGTKLPHVNLKDIYKARKPGTNPNNAGITTLLSMLPNQFGFNRGLQSIKLLNHLGYGYTSLEDYNNYYKFNQNERPEFDGDNHFEVNPDVSLFPLLAYNKIYYDFFRNTQWEENQPYNYNVDYLSADAIVPFSTLLWSENMDYWRSATMFDLRYSVYPKDLFFGVLPNSQFGDEAVVDADIIGDLGDGRVNLKFNDETGVTKNAYVEYNGNIVDSSNTEPQIPVNVSIPLYTQISETIDKLKSSFSILDFRKAKFLQRYKEIVGSGSNDYQSLVKKVFGIDVPDTLADHCIYLGGHSSTININEVVNQNLTEENEVIIKGKGVGSANGNTIEFGEAQEPGIIMCIYHAQPVIDYALDALNFDVTKTEVDDYANPVFDKLGFQGLPFYYLFNRRLNDPHNFVDPFIGYTSRYFDYKTEVDKILGDFRETRVDWVSPINFDYLEQYITQMPGTSKSQIALDASFFHVNPHILDTIFNEVDDTVTSDQLLVSVNFEMHAVRNLDYLGISFN